MGGWFRSELMAYVSVIMQQHVAHDALGRLGDMGVVQFEDMNGDLSAFKRPYTGFIKRCDELERILRFIEAEMKAQGIKPQPCDKHQFHEWLSTQEEQARDQHAQMTLLDLWEPDLKQQESELVEMRTYRQTLLAAYVRQQEMRHLLKNARELFRVDESELEAQMGDDLDNPPKHVSKYGVKSSPSLLGGHRARGSGAAGDGAGAGAGAGSARGLTRHMRFEHVAGVMLKSDELEFQQLLRRVSRGNCFAQFADIEELLEDERGQRVAKVVFIIFFRTAVMERKLTRLCDAYNAHRHELPSFEYAAEVAAASERLRDELVDSARVLQEHRTVMEATLQKAAAVLLKYKRGVLREKSIFHTLNMFDASVPGLLQGRGWVLKDSQHRVIAAVQAAHAEDGQTLPSFLQPVAGRTPTPPTYFRTNKFTGVFQEVVNTYGVPRYREANPALFTAVTFPFLFAIMYGDIGHALLLSIFSAIMVIREGPLSRANLNEVVSMAFGGRYMLLLMGIFSIYCGFVYNDIFSVGVDMFGSRYKWVETVNGTVSERIATSSEDVYPFGVDPVWHVADNQLLFLNSLKMKLSVVFGVVQMTFGITLKMANAIHFGSGLDFWAECVPQMLFMQGLFGYMLFLIFYKWSINWSAPPAGADGAPPSLIDTLIGIALTPGTVHDRMFPGQVGVQLLLLFIVFISVPIMLCVKPLVLRHRAKRSSTVPGAMQLHNTDDDMEHLHNAGAGVGASLGDVELQGFGRSTMGSELPPASGSRDLGSGAGAGAGAGMVHLPPSPREVTPAGGGGGGGGHGTGHGEEFDFVEATIHQAIETIEFVLGTVSNTASYLRLWALSLAHSELAEVFWERALMASVNTGNAVAIFIGYALFAVVTLGVLCVMDVLECFLHALRLHWVEFQNKFYKADGYRFQPFDFEAIFQSSQQTSS